MFKNINWIFKFFTIWDRLRLICIVILSFVAAFFEAVSIGAIIPFIAILIEPQKIKNIDFINYFFSEDLIKEIDNPIFLISSIFLFMVFFSVVFRTYLFRLSTQTAFKIGHTIGRNIYSNIQQQIFILRL